MDTFDRVMISIIVITIGCIAMFGALKSNELDERMKILEDKNKPNQITLPVQMRQYLIGNENSNVSIVIEYAH